MNRRSALPRLLAAAAALAAPLAGCGPSVPEGVKPEQDWSDEVKQAEAAREADAKEKTASAKGKGKGKKGR
jgi:hypothetical protein